MNKIKHPNILFLMSDEHRADVTGYEGNTIIRTPTLDYLAQNGVAFTHCYTPSPICIPARQAMMSGKFCKNCECGQFWDDLTPFYNTFSRWLRDHGYQTVVSGKLHHVGEDQMQGWEKRISGDIQVNNSHLQFAKIASKDPYALAKGKWSDAKEILRAGVWDDKTVDDYVVEGAVEFIRSRFRDARYDRNNPDKPLLLKVSLNKPHYPYLAHSDTFKHYLPRVKPYLNETVFDHPFLQERQIPVEGDVAERDLTRATAAYYAMIDELDAQYKEVLNALEEVGQNLDDWLIVYTSDHGEMLGQHGIWEKQKFFEASVRVPLILHAPSTFGHRVVEENVNTCDLFATLCDFANVPTPTDLDSTSLLPLAKGEACNWNNLTISHFGREDGTNNLMIKKGQLKYQYYGETMPEVLFDLAQNPEETINYATHPDYTAVMEEFRSLIDTYRYTKPLRIWCATQALRNASTK